jgi:hypothetical protein
MTPFVRVRTIIHPIVFGNKIHDYKQLLSSVDVDATPLILSAPSWGLGHTSLLLRVPSASDQTCKVGSPKEIYVSMWERRRE